MNTGFRNTNITDKLPYSFVSRLWEGPVIPSENGHW